MRWLGIDFGTSNSKVAWFDEQRGRPEILHLGREVDRLVPTVLHVSKDGVWTYGDNAVDAVETDPKGCVRVLKRRLAEGAPLRQRGCSYDPTDLTAGFLRWLKAEAEQRGIHAVAEGVVLTVPVLADQAYKERLVAAAQQAGFTQCRLLDESVAAGMAFVAEKAGALDGQVLVFDWGGGTLDVAALAHTDDQWRVIPGATGDLRLGGEDLDEKVLMWIARQAQDRQQAYSPQGELRAERLRQIEKRKCQLSHSERVGLSLKDDVGKPLKLELTRALFEELIADEVNKAVAYVKRVRASATNGEDASCQILLVGGSSSIPLVGSRLRDLPNVNVLAWTRQLDAVALGAAVQAAGASPQTSRRHPTKATETPPTSPQMIAARQRELGLKYLKGEGVAQSDREAFMLLRLAAQAGDAHGQFLLGELHREGRGVAKDEAEAARWYRKAADQGLAEAQLCMGGLCGQGLGVAKDEAEAARWYRKAADQGSAEGQLCTGWLYACGRGVAKDEAEGARWYRKAAEQSNADAQHALGTMYRDGRGVAQNDAAAVECFQLAANQGLPEGQCALGTMYLDGRGVPQWDVKAVECFRQAADHGNADAQYWLGIMYRDRRGVAQDDDEAVKCFRLAANQGNAVGQFLLGNMYELGRGAAQNEDLAKQWYRKAAKQGHAEAQRSLAALLQAKKTIPIAQAQVPVQSASASPETDVGCGTIVVPYICAVVGALILGVFFAPLGLLGGFIGFHIGRAIAEK